LASLKDGKFADGSAPVTVERRIWRAKVQSEFIEPEIELDPSEHLDFLFEQAGRTVLRSSAPLPPRDDIILWSDKEHREQFERNIQWKDCPTPHKPVIEHIIKAFWDVFDQDGALRPIRKYLYSIDIGNHKPPSCKPPRYGPHESEKMAALIRQLEDKNIIEPDEGPYGAMIVLAAKPNQGHVHWTEYVFRLCVSFRLLNAITRPFLFPIPRCDDAIQDIGSATHCITLDLDAGYWQVKLHEKSKEKTGFFIPNGKRHWTHLPMGIKNAAAFFVCVMMQLREEWHDRYRHRQQGIMLIDTILSLY
jgi:hypothetical protein